MNLFTNQQALTQLKALNDVTQTSTDAVRDLRELSRMCGAFKGTEIADTEFAIAVLEAVSKQLEHHRQIGKIVESAR